MDKNFILVPIDIHLAIIKFPTEEMLEDFGINTTDTMTVGSDKRQVLNWIQQKFASEFRRFGTLKESDNWLLNHKVKRDGLEMENR